MKQLISSLFVFLLLTLASCHNSVNSKAEKLFTDFMEFMNQSCGSEIDLKNYKIIYTAPNDSLAVIEFTSLEGNPKAKVTHYMTYVVSDTEDDNYWVTTRANPVKEARDHLRSIDKIFNNGKSSEVSDADITPIIELSAAGALYSGNAMTVKDSYDMIKTLQK